MQGKDISVNFPRIKAIMWFDEIKTEIQAGGALIDWRFSGIQQIRSALAIYIQTPAKSTGQKYWLQLNDFTTSSAPLSCDQVPSRSNSTIQGSNINSTTSSSSTPGGTVLSQTLGPSATFTTASTSRTTPSPTTPAQATPASTPAVTRAANNLAALIGRKLL